MDVTTETFQRDVIEHSYEVPVLVDCWPASSGPSTTCSAYLGAGARPVPGGRLSLAKLSIDSSQSCDGGPGPGDAQPVEGVQEQRRLLMSELVGALPPAVVAQLPERPRVAAEPPSRAKHLVMATASRPGPAAVPGTESTLPSCSSRVDPRPPRRRQGAQQGADHRDAAGRVSRAPIQRAWSPRTSCVAAAASCLARHLHQAHPRNAPDWPPQSIAWTPTASRGCAWTAASGSLELVLGLEVDSGLADQEAVT